MYMPLVAVLIARIPLKGMGWIPRLKGKVGWIFFSAWMPALLAFLGALLYFVIFPGHFDSGLETLRLTAGEEALALMEAQGITLEKYLLITTIASLTYAPFFNILTAIGEETGWRGALYPYLKKRFGRNRGRIIGGLIWGAWHWPVMLLAGYEYGTDYFGAPILGLLVFCCVTVFMGIMHDYVYEKTGTIWMPALYHGATNTWTVYMYLTKPEYTNYTILGPAIVGLISVIPMAVLAIFLSTRKAKETEAIHTEEEIV